MIKSFTRYSPFPFFLVACILGVVVLPGSTASAAVPQANNDRASTLSGEQVTIEILANDSGLSDTPLAVPTVVTQPLGGKVEIRSTPGAPHGYVADYTPNPGFTGTDLFTYQVKDADGDIDEGIVIVNVGLDNTPPLPQQDFYTVEEDGSTTIRLEAKDPDIDYTAPEEHSLSFEIVGGPTHGTLRGDISNVQYEPDHTAYVELTYIPDKGFRGRDSITFQVTDPIGEANMANVLIDVIPVGEAPVGLFGYYNGSITFQDEEKSLSDVTNRGSLTYKYGEFEASATSTWRNKEWNSVDISTWIPWAGAFTNSTLSFDPEQTESFRYLQADTRFTFSEINVSHLWHLSSTADSTYQRITGRWKDQDVYFTATAKFDGYNPAFDQANFRSRYYFPVKQGLYLATDLGIISTGFDRLDVKLGNIPLVANFVLDLDTTYTEEYKEVVPTLRYRAEWLECLRVLMEPVLFEDSETLWRMSIYGLHLWNTFPNDVTARIYTSFDKDRNSAVTGRSEFSNKIALSGPLEVGYQYPGRWEITSYLGSSESNRLFGWGESQLALRGTLTQGLNFDTQIIFSAEQPLWKWQIGAQVYW